MINEGAAEQIDIGGERLMDEWLDGWVVEGRYSSGIGDYCKAGEEVMRGE